MTRTAGPGIGYMVTTIVLDILLGFLAAIIVAWFSRQREFRADAGAAQLMGRKQPMINALARLGGMHPGDMPKSLQAMGIAGGIGKLFSSHPPIEERVAALQKARALIPSLPRLHKPLSTTDRGFLHCRGMSFLPGSNMTIDFHCSPRACAARCQPWRWPRHWAGTDRLRGGAGLSSAGEVVYAPSAPPPLQTEVIPVAPSPVHVWINGYWGWGGASYAWTPRPLGHAAAPGHVWHQPRWNHGPAGWYQRGGRWGPRRHQPRHCGAPPGRAPCHARPWPTGSRCRCARRGSGARRAGTSGTCGCQRC